LWQSPHEEIIVYTDSFVALTQWRKLQPPEKLPSQRRWLGWYEGLSFYDLRRVKFIHLAGEDNTLADLLSRVVSWEGDPYGPVDPYDESEAVRAPTLAMAVQHRHANDSMVKQSEETDRYKARIKLLLETDAEAPALENVVRGDDGLIYNGDFDLEIDGLLDSQTFARAVLYVPDSPLREELIIMSHGRAHSGWKTTFARLRQKFWWPGIRGDVKSKVKACGACAILRK
jgi:hypothetical protein